MVALEVVNLGDSRCLELGFPGFPLHMLICFSMLGLC
jgi:hypothetical protein